MKISAKLVKELREKSSAGIMDCKKALMENNGIIEASIKWLREKGISKANKKKSSIAADGIVNIFSKGNIFTIFEVNTETDFVAKNSTFLKLIKIIENILISNPKITTVEEALKLKSNNVTLNDKIVESIATIGEKISLRRFFTLQLNSDQSIGTYVHKNKSGTLLLFNGKISLDDGKKLSMHSTAMAPKFISRDYISKDFIKSEKEILLKKALSEGKPKKFVDKMVIGRLNKSLAEICFLDQNFVIDPTIKVGKFINDKNVKLVNMIRYEVGEGIEKKVEDFAAEVMKQIKK